ncbi:hypothetical protein KR222_001957, partial [Zaprionus bogoriensis]
LLQQLHIQNNFDYVLIVGKTEEDWSKLFAELPVPAILLDGKSNITYNLDAHHTRNLLTIAFVDESNNGLLEFLSRSLRFWNTEPVLLIVKNNTWLGMLLERCWTQYQLLNVLAIFDDFEHSGILYSYSPFPKFHLEELHISNSTNPIIVYKLENLQGYKLPIMVGGSTPRLIVYRQPSGDLVYAGIVGHLKQCFELRYNCHLVEPMPLNESSMVPARQLLGAVHNASVQFVLAAIFMEPPIDGYIYPFELLNWCFMMPVPELVPHSDLYSRVLDLNILLIVITALVLISVLLTFALRLNGYSVQPYEMLMHDNCLRGALGQGFNEVRRASTLVRGIYMEICVLGFLFTAWYNSYFSAYITSGLHEKPFSSFENILQSHFKIVIWTPEYQKLIRYSDDLQYYTNIFKLEPSYTRFLQIRDSFNTRYGYMMPLEKWNLVSQQQKFFSSPLFTFREDLCAYRGVPVAFPIVNNSVFREPLERLIGEVTATGLMAHWRDNALIEMIRARKLKIVDLSKPYEFRAMELKDLKYILEAGGLMMALACSVFALEHLIY